MHAKLGGFIEKIKKSLITDSYINARMQRGWNQKKAMIICNLVHKKWELYVI